MRRTTYITFLAAALLVGCSDGAMLGAGQTSPKRAAALCNAYDDRFAPTQDEARVVDTYQAGKISFNDCMRRLRS